MEERRETFHKFYKIVGKSEKSSVTLKSGSWTETVRIPNVKVRDSPQLSPLTVVHIYCVHTLPHGWDYLHQHNVIESTTDG